MDEREEQQELNSKVGQLTTTVQALDHKLQMVSASGMCATYCHIPAYTMLAY
jgi:hypothetical protein